MHELLAIIGAICLAYFALNAIAVLTFFLFCSFSGTERSEAPQGCPPSAMGSDSAAPTEPASVKSQPAPVAKPMSNGKAEDEASDDSSVVQLPKRSDWHGDLAACPFCGSSNVYLTFYNRPSVTCQTCWAGGPSAARLDNMESNKKQAGLEACLLWNKRAATHGSQPVGTPSAAGVSGGS